MISQEVTMCEKTRDPAYCKGIVNMAIHSSSAQKGSQAAQHVYIPHVHVYIPVVYIAEDLYREQARHQ